MTEVTDVWIDEARELTAEDIEKVQQMFLDQELREPPMFYISDRQALMLTIPPRPGPLDPGRWEWDRKWSQILG